MNSFYVSIDNGTVASSKILPAPIRYFTVFLNKFPINQGLQQFSVDFKYVC